MSETPWSCPICGLPLSRRGDSLLCPSRHCFDVARQGYVNLLRRPSDTLYEDRSLFAARRAVWRAGFFDPVIRAVRERLPDGFLLDAGCGEGSLLGALREESRPCAGVDLSRAAVRIAASAYRDIPFAVADVCSLPLAAGAAACVVNMLTPANYAEFARVLRPGGRLIKLVPNAQHLAQIRSLAGKAPYTREAETTLEGFSRLFRLTERTCVRYEVECGAELASLVFRMTPLTAGETAPACGPMRVTVDITLLVGEAPDGESVAAAIVV